MISHRDSNISHEQRLAAESVNNWENYWSVQLNNPPKIKISGLMKFLKYNTGLDLIVRIVENEFKDIIRGNVLEAGSGTGAVSLRLAQNSGLSVLVDTSLSALKMSEKAAENLNVQPFISNGSIFNLPFKDAAFDFVFNVGVVDHFGPEYRKLAVLEMVRVLKKSGKAVIVTNNARGIIHDKAMKYAMKQKRWNFGFKDAIYSLKEIGDELPGNYVIREYSCGFVSQFEFLQYYIPQKVLLLKLFYRLFCLFSLPLSFLNHLPGQYLVTVIESR